MWWHKWLVLWSLWAARLVRQPGDTLSVSNGLLRGVIAPDGSHISYNGIPYGTTTLETTFQAPGPEPKWDGIHDAIDEHIRCHQQLHFKIPILVGQRDCLTLNVHTPLQITPKSKRPVMLFIHGGAFLDGSGSYFLYGPRYLVTKDVILVTVNYRLYLQGFLCLGIKEAPGNAGMKDIVAALKWVRRNIDKFGGDPDNVTVFGESAGGASVSYLLLSPMAKGLFHKGIIQSGSSTAPWAFQFRPVFLASLLGKVMGVDTENPHELYKLFMTKSEKEVMQNRVPRQQGTFILSEMLYTPCAEKHIEGVEPFLTELPYDLLSKGEYHKVPVIIGGNAQEGIMIQDTDIDAHLSEIEIVKSLPKNLHIPTQKEREEVANELKNLYFGDEEVSLKTAAKMARWIGESFLNFPVLIETELLANTTDQPVYSYMFSYDGWRNICKFLAGSRYKELIGATHADELFYLFSQHIIPTFFENKIIDRMTTMWTNFAKYGDPTPEQTELLPVKWLPVNSSSSPTLVIDTEFSTMPLWYNEAVRYWKQIYFKYRRKL